MKHLLCSRQCSKCHRYVNEQKRQQIPTLADLTYSWGEANEQVYSKEAGSVARESPTRKVTQVKTWRWHSKSSRYLGRDHCWQRGQLIKWKALGWEQTVGKGIHMGYMLKKAQRSLVIILHWQPVCLGNVFPNRGLMVALMSVSSSMHMYLKIT